MRTTVERMWRRDFCDGAQLHHADLKKRRVIDIGEVLCHTLVQCARRGNK